MVGQISRPEANKPLSRVVKMVVCSVRLENRCQLTVRTSQCTERLGGVSFLRGLCYLSFNCGWRTFSPGQNHTMNHERCMPIYIHRLSFVVLTPCRPGEVLFQLRHWQRSVRRTIVAPERHDSLFVKSAQFTSSNRPCEGVM